MGNTQTQAKALDDAERASLDRWWRAANYLVLGQTYLMDNPLLRQPLLAEQIKPTLLGHWGSAPGLNFIWAHLNRVIRKRDINMVVVFGPGHCGHAMIANGYLEGTYSELYPDVSLDEEGLRRLFKQFSFPGGVPSHAAPETPGSFHEGGELGYCLLHGFGAVFDNPDLIATVVVSDGEAETGPLAASWHSNKFLNPARDGAVLPILHLNGYKIAMPTVLARIGEEDLDALLRGYGWDPITVEGDDPTEVHDQMAAALDRSLDRISAIQHAARSDGSVERPRWPMIVLRTPAGWTAPKEVRGKPAEGTWRCHLTPLEQPRTDPEELALLEQWLRSYKPEELFDANGAPASDIREFAPVGDRRLSANPHSNGGGSPRPLRRPDFAAYGVTVSSPGSVDAEATRVLSAYLRDVLVENRDRFRIFGPDETSSNRLSHLYEVTEHMFLGERNPRDENLGPNGRIMDVLSEHLCQGWLEGYLLTGRHGVFNTYEAFAHVVDSMFNQHAKWVGKSRNITWRRPIPSLNYLLTSHVWRQDHNGFTHQDPGFLDVVLNKKSDVVRVYLPPDANCLLAVMDHCLSTQNRVNAIVADKQAAPVWLDMEAAIRHVRAGVSIWDWASTDEGGEPDLVMACAGDVPTLETLAAVQLLAERFPSLRIRTINVVDLMVLQAPGEHPHALDDRDFDDLFTVDKPVIFNFHGYPRLIHELTYRRTNHQNFHVRGYKEEGSVTTPFDMAVQNQIDRFDLVADAVERVDVLRPYAGGTKQWVREKLSDHDRYIRATGEDLPEIRDWRFALPARHSC